MNSINSEQCYQQANHYFDVGEYGEAARLASMLVQQFPEFASGWYVLSKVAERDGKIQLATKASLKSVSLDRENPLHLLQLGRCYRLIGQSGKAIMAAHSAEKSNVLNARALDLLGTLYFRCGENEAALRCHQQAFDKEPDNFHVRYNFASSLQVMGQLDEAAEHYQAVITARPFDYQAHHSVANLRKATVDRNHVERLKGLLTNLKQDQALDEHLICYSLAKELEDLSDYDASISFLQRGAKRRRSTFEYDVNQDVALMGNIAISVDSEAVADLHSNCDSQEPIFIVGMPRSGTTLVEQIVSAHPSVFAAGELHNFGQAVFATTKYSTPTAFLDDRQLELLKQADMTALGQHYINSTRPRTGHTPHFIDKLPMNSIYCGHIHRALPKAKIILLDRHPVDVCYSNYKMSFKSGYEYSYDLKDLGTYYLAWSKLMDHWRATLPSDNFYTIRYEDLIANQEQESRRLIEFCGLEWNDDCLEFYRNAEGVATASAAQVRKPIYPTSVAKWKHYETQLQPLIDTLLAGGADLSDR